MLCGLFMGHLLTEATNVRELDDSKRCGYVGFPQNGGGWGGSRDEGGGEEDFAIFLPLQNESRQRKYVRKGGKRGGVVFNPFSPKLCL